MNRDNEDIDGREGNLRIVASSKRKRNSQIITSDDDRAPISTLMKRTSQIITSDDETSCDDTAPISTLVRSKVGSVDEVKKDSSRRNLKSAKTKRPGEISDDDDDDTSNEDSVPKSAIKTRYRSKSTTGFQYGVQEGARKRRSTRLRKSEIKNEQDDENSFDLKKSACLKEISSSDDEENNDALEDKEDDNSVEDDEDYEGLEDEEDTDDSADEEDFDDEQDEEDSDDPGDEEDNDSVDEDDDGDSTNKSENAIIDSEGNLGIILSAKRKRTSLIFASDDETSCDDKDPISTLMRSRIDSGDEVKGNASRQSLRSAKTKRAGKITDDDDDDDETDYEGSVPKNTIKTRYRSKCMTGFEDAGKRNLRRLRKSEIKNEQNDENSSDLRNSFFLQENSSSDDEEDNDALEDEEDYDGEEDKEDNESVEEDDDGDSYDAINDSEPDMDMSEVYSPDTISAKTKRVTQIIVSDDEISYDDNSPTTTLRTQHNTTFSTGYSDEVKYDESKQSPTKLTESESENEQEDESSCDLNQTIRLDVYSSGDEEDNDGPEEGSTSERDTLGGFIVSDNEDEPNDADDHELEEVLDPFGRQNVSNQKWDFEGEMLADFGKNTELCMRAVCVLYRQQAADEKAAKETIYRNKRGFSQTDALRGCKLAEFLTDRDPAGILKKTVEELKQHNFKWIKLCHALAAKYSKQLFQIYKNKEDPYFPE